ncbi:MAG: 6-phosphogluconolactonase [Spirochaetota bacterium]
MEPKLTIHSMPNEEIAPFILHKLEQYLLTEDTDVVTIGIPGGRSASHIVTALSGLEAEQLQRIQLLLVDERCSGERNRDTLLAYGIDTLLSSGLLLEKQLTTVEQYLDLPLPEIDLLFLGMGEDGHFASLFPGSYPQLDSPETEEVLTISDSPKPPKTRVTLSYRGLRNKASQAAVYLLALGESKRNALERLILRERPADLPCAFIPEVIGAAAVITDLEIHNQQD